mmetsp:Transcript_5206/g.5969  ORF Transcript_5206/g.5969 Transcript_5206/m.5969 type:complete len:409 (-) Transcript_5206:800-2026(-)
MEEIIAERKDMEQTFFNQIDDIEQSLLSKYVDSVKKFNKAYFSNKAEALKQQRKMEGNDINTLIAKINENYMKNGNNISGDIGCEEDDYYQSDYKEDHREDNSRSETPCNYRSRRSTHNKTTGPSHSSVNQRYRENKLQTSTSRVPFQIFDQNMRTPNYNEGYENMEVDEHTPEKHISGKVKEFSLCYSDSSSDGERHNSGRSSPKAMLPSERLRKISDSKAELLEANEFCITVRITPSAHEVNIQNNSISFKKNKRERKSKHGYRYVNTYKTKNIKEEINIYESEKENNDYAHYKTEKHNKRAKKMMYKRSKEALLDTPPTLYKLGNIDKRAHKGDYYGYRGVPAFDPHGAYYVVPSRMHPNPYAYYNPNYHYDNQSPMFVKLDKKYPKEKLAQFYPPFLGMPPVGT